MSSGKKIVIAVGVDASSVNNVKSFLGEVERTSIVDFSIDADVKTVAELLKKYDIVVAVLDTGFDSTLSNIDEDIVFVAASRQDSIADGCRDVIDLIKQYSSVDKSFCNNVENIVDELATGYDDDLLVVIDAAGQDVIVCPCLGKGIERHLYDFLHSVVYKNKKFDIDIDEALSIVLPDYEVEEVVA